MLQYLQEIKKRKDLMIYLVTSGLKAQHRNSYLGYVWWLLDPLLGIGIYYFLMVILLNRGGPDYGGFLVVGMVAWRWVSSTVNASAKSIVTQSGIVSKVYLPKAIFPIGTALSQLINFFFGLLIIIIYLLISRTVPGINLLWLPLVMLVQFLFLLAIGLIIAYLCVFIRDIDNITTHVMRLWFYASPVIWERGRLPARLSWIVKYNPISAILASYRNILLHNGAPELKKLMIIGLFSLALVAALLAFYHQNEHKIIKAL
ncbi:MAG TPA: ABC transporter permease [Oscillospiraceae bacterium]|nr:ABC transporter permease [Oscillospiraceae bacterium]